MSHNSNNTNAISKPEGQNPEDTNASKTSESDSSTTLSGVDYKPTIGELLKALFEHLTNETSEFRLHWAIFEAKWGKVQLDDFCSDPSPKKLVKRLAEKANTDENFDHFDMFAQMLAYNPFSAILDRYITTAGYNGQDHSKIRVIIADNWSIPNTLSTALKPFLNIGVIVVLYPKLYHSTLLWDDVQKEIAELKNEIAGQKELAELAAQNKQMKQIAATDDPNDLVKLYFDSSLRFCRSLNDNPTERAYEHVLSFLLAMIDKALLPHFPITSFKYEFNRSIPWLTQIMTGLTEQGSLSKFAPDGMVFFDDQLLYAFEVKNLKGTHAEALKQLINSIKLQPALTKLTLIFFTLVGNKAQIHTYSLKKGHTQLGTSYNLGDLDGFRNFITNFSKLVVDHLDKQSKSVESPRPGTHYLTLDGSGSITHVLKCINSYTPVCKLFKNSLQQLKLQLLDNFVCEVQATPFENFRPPPSSINVAQLSTTSLTNHRSSPLVSSKSNYGNGESQSFFSAQFSYIPGTPLSDSAKFDVTQLFDSLQTLHSKQFVHCDIRPPNIIYRTCEQTGKEIYILIDFGYCVYLPKINIDNIRQLLWVLCQLKTFCRVFDQISGSDRLVDIANGELNPSYDDVKQLSRLCIVVDLYSLVSLNDSSPTIEQHQKFLLNNWNNEDKIGKFSFTTNPSYEDSEIALPKMDYEVTVEGFQSISSDISAQFLQLRSSVPMGSAKSITFLSGTEFQVGKYGQKYDLTMKEFSGTDFSNLFKKFPLAVVTYKKVAK